LLNFIARRLVVAMFQLVGLVLVVFFAIRMLPADPVARLVGMNSTPEAYRMSQQAQYCLASRTARRPPRPSSCP